MANKDLSNDTVTERLNDLRGATRERPKYEIIKEFLLQEFMQGRYEAGQSLPSENTLVATLGVARSTVRQALKVLEREGFVERFQGKGSFFKQVPTRDAVPQLEVFSIIVPDIASGLYPTLVKGFDHQAGMTHQQVMVCNTAFDTNKQGNIILQMIEKNVAGVVMVPSIRSSTPSFHIRQLQKNKIPIVFCHRGVQDCAAPLITWDREEAVRLAGQAFANRGHRHIAYFARYRYVQTEVYESGLRETLHDRGLELPESHVYYGTDLADTPNGRNQTAQTLKSMLRGRERVTAIFCNDDEEAELIHHLATEMGLKVPQDLSIIGFGNSSERKGVFRSRLTSVAVNEFELGAHAARVLREIRGARRPLDSHEIIHEPLTLVEGTTLGPVPV